MRAKNPWWVVFGVFAGLIVGNGPLMQFSFGVFIKPLAEEFGADRATISGAVLVGLVITGVCTPFAGRLIDRYGVRAITLPAILLFALAMAALALAPSIYAFIAIYGLAGVVAAGQTPLPYSKAIVGAFEGRRGIALGVSTAGVGVGTVVMPQIAQALVMTFGWRAAYVGLGALVFLCAFPAVYFFVRDPLPSHASAGLPGLTGREALGGKEFWYLAVIFFAVTAATGGVIAHIVPILTDRGVPAQVAASAIGAAGLSLIVGRLIAGYLLDRIFAPYVAFVLFLLPLVGMGLLYFALSPKIAVVAAICMGAGLGSEIDLIAYLISRYMGLRSFGEIYGYLFAIFMLASGMGPFLMGLSFTRTGSYGAAIVGLALALVVACVLVLLFGPYRFPAAKEPIATAEAVV